MYVTLDADVVKTADVPGVSAPNAAGLPGERVLSWASPFVSSFDLVGIDPRLDRAGRSARWAVLAVWQFLTGLAGRRLLSGG